MTRLLKEQSGFSLVELMTAIAIMIAVLSGTLAALQHFSNVTQQDQQLLEAQDRARIALDRAARELRNGSAYATDASQPSAILRAGPWDLIMQTVNPTQPAGANSNTLNLMRVRYCLNTLTNTLYRQWQTWTSATAPSMPSDTACPSTSWGTTNQTVVASDVVNGGSRRVFTYNSGNANDVNEAPPLLPDIVSVRMALWIDLNPGKAPAETQLHTGVFLRNKNRRPTASCTAAATGSSNVSLNGSASTDPEGGMLTFTWQDGTSAAGSGSLVNYKAPTTGSHTFTVTVTDTGGLTATATCSAVVV